MDEELNQPLEIVELDERLEFGAAIIGSDLDADANTGCVNQLSCTNGSHTGCTNGGC